MFVFVSNSPGVECRGIWPYELTCDTNARKPQIICMTLRQIIVFLGKDFRMASFSCLGSMDGKLITIGFIAAFTSVGCVSDILWQQLTN